MISRRSMLLALIACCHIALAADTPKAKPKAGENGFSVKKKIDVPAAKPAVEADWQTEYEDAILSVKVVDDVGAAIAHIGHYSSHHTEAIISEDPVSVERFFTEIDSAILLHNASTQFADGGEFGFGGEIGIATGKFHARGPVGLEQLCSFKYVVRGSGQTRP